MIYEGPLAVYEIFFSLLHESISFILSARKLPLFFLRGVCRILQTWLMKTTASYLKYIWRVEEEFMPHNNTRNCCSIHFSSKENVPSCCHSTSLWRPHNTRPQVPHPCIPAGHEEKVKLDGHQYHLTPSDDTSFLQCLALAKKIFDKEAPCEVCEPLVHAHLRVCVRACVCLCVCWIVHVCLIITQACVSASLSVPFSRSTPGEPLQLQRGAPAPADGQVRVRGGDVRHLVLL